MSSQATLISPIALTSAVGGKGKKNEECTFSRETFPVLRYILFVTTGSTELSIAIIVAFIMSLWDNIKNSIHRLKTENLYRNKILSLYIYKKKKIPISNVVLRRIFSYFESVTGRLHCPKKFNNSKLNDCTRRGKTYLIVYKIRDFSSF